MILQTNRSWLGRFLGARSGWTGNRNGFEDPEGMRLSTAFQSSLVSSERAQIMKSINDYIISNMLVLPIDYLAVWMAARKGVNAYGD